MITVEQIWVTLLITVVMLIVGTDWAISCKTGRPMSSLLSRIYLVPAVVITILTLLVYVIMNTLSTESVSTVHSVLHS
jgi:hypothetical protein